LGTNVGYGLISLDGQGNGQTCVAIGETKYGDPVMVTVVWPKYTDHGALSPLACYTTELPYALEYPYPGISLC
jgi:hypothetical protein